MQAKQIGRTRPEYQAVDTPQCVGEIIGLQPSYRKAQGKQCFRASAYELDGKPYCAFHAGRIALVALLAES